MDLQTVAGDDKHIFTTHTPFIQVMHHFLSIEKKKQVSYITEH